MLEDVAGQYVSQPADYRQLARLGAIIVGAALAGIFHRTNDTMQRAPYFALYGILFLVVTASQFAWLGADAAMATGFFWVLALSDLAVPLAAGYAVSVISMARSRDAYGNGLAAILAFIPILFLWLIFAPSRAGQSPDSSATKQVLGGWRGVLVGLSCAVGSFVGVAFLAAQSPRPIAETAVQEDALLPSQKQAETSPVSLTSISPEISAQNARNGKVSWSAFECASLAVSQEEAERLFQVGYRAGLAFVQDVQLRRINKEDIDREVPVAFLLALRGPTPDFMLGRVFEAAQGSVFEDITEAALGSVDQDIRRLHSESLFNRQNCALLRFP
jgi:hypothetical protein